MSKGTEIIVLLGIAAALLVAFFVWGIVWHNVKTKNPGTETNLSWKHSFLHQEFQPALLFLTVMFILLSGAVAIWA